jgi:xanthine phosphoribosyltransferase
LQRRDIRKGRTMQRINAMGDHQAYRKDFPVSWDEMHLLDKGPLEGGKWKGVIAITRGGLVPACIMARELEVLTVETFCISTYDVKDMGKSNILKMPAAVEGDGEGWLVVDDLVDTGGTFRLIRQHFPKAHYACLYAKPKGEDTVDTFITAVSQDTWIHFPWDLEIQYATPLARKEDKNP